MTDFVLEQYESTKNPTLFEETVHNYANFLKQPLTLGMFVPCDDDGNVLQQDCDVIIKKCRNCSCREYEKAQSKVLFNNFKMEYYPVKKFENISATLRYKNCYVGIIHKDSDKMKLNDTCSKETIEDLIPYNLDLAVSF